MGARDVGWGDGERGLLVVCKADLLNVDGGACQSFGPNSSMCLGHDGNKSLLMGGHNCVRATNNTLAHLSCNALAMAMLLSTCTTWQTPPCMQTNHIGLCLNVQQSSHAHLTIDPMHC